MPPLFLPTHTENQAAMAAYMRNQFDFLGVKAPERQLLTRPIKAQSRQLTSAELSDWLAFYYAQPAREYHYVAIELALANVKRLTPAQYQWCQDQVTVQAWWDSVDSWRKVLATYIFQHDALTDLGPAYLSAMAMWQRRLGITLQLSRKTLTDTVYLTAAIEMNQADPEFFIQKAIGWALRDYSKTAPEWVTDFLSQHDLSPLAVREASKYL
ncbi:DNA alkylation repair protein [Lactiplantibacillus daowaiensis]|uniref:DNA alkylation repair protein n=1 Tax=Lactiplantibacillus daowaiensis TaxID=2559918 RepID=A0ABW1S1Y0_9LACO|nr:DNA alkylation repair protein [Lactiplantibacillus daowaiensis]